MLQGFRTQRDYDQARRALMALPIFTMVGPDLALQSAVNYRHLRQRGVTVRKTIDCMIATFVISRGFALLHSDHDFDPFAQHLGLTVVEL